MADSDDDFAFDPSLISELDHRLQPLKRLLSPVSLGCEHIPREGPVLLTGNHSIYGLVDIPMLGLEIFEKTGRTIRGLADHNHFALPLWRDLLQGIGAVRGTREVCSPGRGRVLPAGRPVVRNADIGGDENAACFSYPRIDSLFRSWNSLFESVGNSFPAGWICTGISAEPASAMRESGGLPCSFPVEQGSVLGDEFAVASPHRH